MAFALPAPAVKGRHISFFHLMQTNKKEKKKSDFFFPHSARINALQNVEDCILQGPMA